MKKRLQASIGPEKTIVLELLEQKNTVPSSLSTFETQLFDLYEKMDESWMLLLAFSGKKPFLPSLQFLHHFLHSFAEAVLATPDLAGEQLKKLKCDEKTIEKALLSLPTFVGAEHVDAPWLFDLWTSLQTTFFIKRSDFDGSTAEYIQYLNPKTELPGRVYFHLVENKGKDDPFAFLATYSTHEKSTKAIKHVPLQHALQEFRGDDKKLLKLLSAVYKSAKNSELIDDLLESGDIFYPLGFTPTEASIFLKEVVEYENAGVLCRIPDWWTAKSRKTSVSVSIGSKKPPKVGLAAILDASPTLMVDGVAISLEEAKRLIAASEGLAFIKNKWVAVDPEKLQQALDAYEKMAPMLKDGLTLADAMRMQLNLEKKDEKDPDLVDVSSGEWLQNVIHNMSSPADMDEVVPTPDFSAQLRPYQQHGLNWLHALHQLGFGGCLADDMGLGKTIQLLAFMSLLRNETNQPSLLVLPASLLANWKQEIQRFLPSLKVFFAHPSMLQRGFPKKLNEKSVQNYHLVITTYALVQRKAWIAEQPWHCVILDEAQAIKNPATKQSKSIKKLHANIRFALTGTPLENKLSDLWSLFDFLNPGLLGNATEFKAYSKSLDEHPEAYGRLRQVISPFILRRKKTDKNIISDLPDKVEVKTYADLSRQQVVLYRKMLADLEQRLTDTTPMERRGLILSVLMKCKQLCNHPAQYLGNGAYSETDSGKFKRLREICETIYEKRERVLIFTQFKEITQPLHDFLATLFEHPGRILHGSVAVKKRQQLVAEFQDPRHYVPFMVLSIKAGGVGLNLTQANHVIHFDRWWNPAVENQATDRAFRIGQKKDVLVHKFITRGTIEERIDEMLEEKKSLFDNVVEQSSTAKLTEMNNDELLDLFTLRL